MYAIGSTRTILLGLNSIIGTGLFVNIKSLYCVSGMTSPFVYLLCAGIMFPILWTMLTLASSRPVAAGLFIHIQDALGPYAAFASTWAYFLSKATSAAIIVSFFIQALGGCDFCFGSVWISKMIVIFTIILLNTSGINLGGKIQYLFTFVKSMAFISISAAGIYFLIGGKSNFIFSAQTINFSSLISGVPVAIYALTGFEILVTIAHQIKHPERIRFYGSFAFILGAVGCFLVQGCATILAGKGLILANDSISALAVSVTSVSLLLFKLTEFSIKTSALASAFTLLANNCWNLRAMAKFLPLGDHLLPINKFNVPHVALFAQGVLSLLVTSLSSNIVSLQCMFGFSTSVSFLMFCLAAGVTYSRNWANVTTFDKVLQKLSVLSCSYLLYRSVLSVLSNGISQAYFIVFAAGFLLAAIKSLFIKT